MKKRLPSPTAAALKRAAWLATWVLWSAPAAADPALPAPLQALVQAFSTQTAQAAQGQDAARGLRVEVLPGSLDPRLKLAPCNQIQPYLPAGLKPWGRTRVGLRCVDGVARWNVSLPITVRVFGQALVAALALPAGSTLEEGHLKTAEVDLAGADTPPVALPARAMGRTLARPLAAGQPLFESDLKKRQVFATGDAVTVVALGLGFAVTGEAVALTPGFEGQPVRLRSDSGRTLQGVATGDRRAEVAL